MNTTDPKQELIKAAYGEHYEKCQPDENGWSKIFEHYPGEETTDIEYSFSGVGQGWRLKQLSGIEANNGWTRILPDGSNLPDDDLKYWAFNNNYIYNYVYSSAEIRLDYRLNKEFFTHFQPITKPEPPLW